MIARQGWVVVTVEPCGAISTSHADVDGWYQEVWENKDQAVGRANELLENGSMRMNDIRPCILFVEEK